MESDIKKIASLQEAMRDYSGRRLQFAIKMGILPPPENLSQLMKKQARNSSRNAYPSNYWKEKLPLSTR